MLLSRYKFSQASSDGSIIIALVPKVKENIRKKTFALLPKAAYKIVSPTQNSMDIFFFYDYFHISVNEK